MGDHSRLGHSRKPSTPPCRHPLIEEEKVLLNTSSKYWRITPKAPYTFIVNASVDISAIYIEQMRYGLMTHIHALASVQCFILRFY